MGEAEDVSRLGFHGPVRFAVAKVNAAEIAMKSALMGHGGVDPGRFHFRVERTNDIKFCFAAHRLKSGVLASPSPWNIEDLQKLAAVYNNLSDNTRKWCHLSRFLKVDRSLPSICIFCIKKRENNDLKYKLQFIIKYWGPRTTCSLTPVYRTTSSIYFMRGLCV